MKKGQVTVFIIIALIIVGFIIGILFFSKFSLKNKNPMSIPIEAHIQSCIEQSIEDGFGYISFHGGYYEVSEKSATHIFTQIPYYFYLRESFIPSKKVMEKELSKYLENELPLCVNLSVFEEQGYGFKSGKINVEVNLGRVSDIEVRYPITITKSEETMYLKEFKSESDFDFERVYNIVTQFTKEHEKTPDFIPIGYLSVLAEDNNFTFDLTYLSDDEIVYTFVFPFKNDENLIYNFAAQYDWDLIKSLNEEIKIKAIPRQTVYEGIEFSYDVNLEVESPNVMFTDYTDLFDINKNTGEIKFIPIGDNSGKNNILIKAYDDFGNEDTYMMILDIERNLESLINVNQTGNYNG